MLRVAIQVWLRWEPPGHSFSAAGSRYSNSDPALAKVKREAPAHAPLPYVMRDSVRCNLNPRSVSASGVRRACAAEST